MSRKGDCWDNAVAESFFGTLKQELVIGGRSFSTAAIKQAIANYIHDFYNTKRLHSTNGYQSPLKLVTNQCVTALLGKNRAISRLH